MLLPLAIALLGFWEKQRGADDLMAVEATATQLTKTVASLEARPRPSDGRVDFGMRFQQGGQNYVGPLALERARGAQADANSTVTLFHWRQKLAPVVMVGAALASTLSLVILLGAVLLARLGRGSRDALVQGFEFTRRVLPSLLGAQVLLVALASVAAMGFEGMAILANDNLSSGGVKVAALIVGGIVLCLWTAGAAVLGLRHAAGAFTPDPLPIEGRVVPREAAPGLWRMVDDLAAKLGALRPDNVVVGVTGGFFVSSGAKVLQPGNAALTGRTLYLPLSLLPLLREDEVAAIIGHELAHFSGGDTEYSQRFLPIYMGVERSLDAVFRAGMGGDGRPSLLTRPALRLGSFVINQFHHAVRHWSRRREFEADAAGASATSAEAQIRALLRTGGCQPRIDELLGAAFREPSQAPPDLVAATLAHAAARGPDDPETYLEDIQPHPTDTHPPTRQRIAALGWQIDAALLSDMRIVPGPEKAGERLRGLFNDPSGLCREASADFLAAAREAAREHFQALEQAAHGIPAGPVTVSENTRLGGMVLIAFGAVLGLTVAGLAVTGVPGHSTQELSIVLGAASILALVFLIPGILAWRRGERPFVTFTPDALQVVGLDRPIPWRQVADVDFVFGKAGVATRLLLSHRAELPARHRGARRRVKIDAGRRIITFGGTPPKTMKAEGFMELIAAYRRAEFARRLLAEQASDDTVIPPSGTAPAPAIAEQMREAPPPSPPPTLPPLGSGKQEALWSLLGTLIFGAMLTTLGIFMVPDLVTDWQVRGSASPATQGRVSAASCSTRLVITTCDISIEPTRGARAATREMNLLFASAGLGHFSVRLLADPARPEWATTDFGLDRLWNRTITALVIGSILLVMTLAPIVVVWRRFRLGEGNG
ncbi:M48 family metallopeptidase [Plastoroseomonas arctica]|uniref:M48 family metalloprotease n=1 Tax=Plastoroseomonas arctica TaxID=1509237 RepID=A0AAF1JZH3_9PROT|nr:M48 family metalloprotease [Plastoroseomonas arctica]